MSTDISATSSSSSSSSSSASDNTVIPHASTPELKDIQLIKQGAEGRVYSCTFFSRPCIVKERFSKKYRHPLLDEKLSNARLTQEVRCMFKCRKAGVYTPAIYHVDDIERKIYMEHINGVTTKERLWKLDLNNAEDFKTAVEIARRIGRAIAGIHNAQVVHGDLTTSNLMLLPTPDDPLGHPVVLDFGLASVTHMYEDRAVDLYVLERAFLSSHPNSEKVFEEVLAQYVQSFREASKVLARLHSVRQRGRKRAMIG